MHEPFYDSVIRRYSNLEVSGRDNDWPDDQRLADARCHAIPRILLPSDANRSLVVGWYYLRLIVIDVVVFIPMAVLSLYLGTPWSLIGLLPLGGAVYWFWQLRRSFRNERAILTMAQLPEGAELLSRGEETQNAVYCRANIATEEEWRLLIEQIKMLSAEQATFLTRLRDH